MFLLVSFENFYVRIGQLVKEQWVLEDYLEMQISLFLKKIFGYTESYWIFKNALQLKCFNKDFFFSLVVFKKIFCWTEGYQKFKNTWHIYTLDGMILQIDLEEI